MYSNVYSRVIQNKTKQSNMNATSIGEWVNTFSTYTQCCIISDQFFKKESTIDTQYA
jgi:hypothetical protein